ncbi:putative NAD(P)-binding protein [Maribacter vaceletii]|uniref:Putative NAD(P)-binding protein n=1 Tax=Maribacter vaceletii TaxID=1206816 RepID=A0A495DTM2_9FLAO|nr:NAD(P)-binding protein [Maribacter vaceletii]RKR07976.1 putative NAD(P)-binding protein [Maribacter vaceletii]
MKTDYLIIGAGAMGIAFADEIFTRNSNITITLIDRRAKPGGHWNNAYPFVGLHQPAAFYGVNSEELGTNTTHLSSKPEILDYYKEIIQKFESSGRVKFFPKHNYLGNNQVVDLNNPENIITFQVNKKVVDATYMNVEVPSTHPPKYKVDNGVPLKPLNNLDVEYNKWGSFYVIGSGKTGMDAILYLLKKGVNAENINWIAPNDAWLFNRSHIQVGKISKELLKHAELIKNANKVDDVFLEMEKEGGIFRIDNSIAPVKWRCATVSPEELILLRSIKKIIRKGRIESITNKEIQLQKGTVAYPENTLFVDCTANGLSKREKRPIFSEKLITLQAVLFCQQVFSAAVIARLELTNISDTTRNNIEPVPHPEFKEDWPKSMSTTINNLLVFHRHFPLWMFRSRLNFMSHEPMLQYFGYAIKAALLSGPTKKAVSRLAKIS